MCSDSYLMLAHTFKTNLLHVQQIRLLYFEYVRASKLLAAVKYIASLSK